MTLPHYVAAVVEYTTSVLWAKEELLQSNTEHSRPATTEDLCKFFLPSFLHNSAAKEIVACLICEYETTSVSAVGPIKAFFESANEGVPFTSLIHESYMEWSSTQFVREDTFASGVALFLRALNSNALLYGPYVEEEQAVVVAHSPLIGASSLEPSVGPTITEDNSNSGSLYCSPEGSFPHSLSSTGLGSVPSLPMMLYACIQMSAAFREGTPYHRCSSPEEDEWLMVYRARVLEWVGFNVLNIVPHTYTVFLCATPLKESLLCPRVIESTLNFISDIQCNLDLMVDEASAPCVVAAASMLLATRMHLSVSLEELLGVVHSRWPTRYASFFERVIEFFQSSTTNCT